MESDTDVAEELQLLEQRWKKITDESELPRSTMDVIEYGLGKQRRAEVYVNRLLCYLLDPEQPHQMGTDFLRVFLNGLPAACNFEEDTYDLSDVQVSQQVPVWGEPSTTRDPDASPGYLDLLLEVPNEWFLLVELKFSAAETGTEFYCNAAQFGDRPTSAYTSGQYYLYLHQKNRPVASGHCFSNFTWQAFVSDVLEPFLAANAARYPQRTATQLHDLRDDIRTITGMSDRSTSDREKVELYLEHIDAIADVTATFKNAWDDYSRRWGQEMVASLEHPRVSSETEIDTEYTEMIVHREPGDDERWICYDSGGDWQHVFKYGWRRRENEDTLLIQRPDDRDDLRIGFYHRMGDSNRDVAIRDHELRFNFRCMGSNPTAFRGIYYDRFQERSSTLEDCLATTNAEMTGQKQTLIRGTYPIDVDGHEDFFTAYTTALSKSLVELIVENRDLVRILGEIFEESITEYRDTS